MSRPAGSARRTSKPIWRRRSVGAGQRSDWGATGRPRPGRDMQYSLTVSFVDAASGTTRRLALPDGKTLDVRIPPGTEDGHVLRLRGQGAPGFNGAAAGDALIEITVAPDPRFHRDGDDIVTDVPVSLKEAVLGVSLEVPTIHGPVKVSIPPGSGTGTRLRLRGKGIRQGHQFVQVQVVVPPGDEPELAAFLKSWAPNEELFPEGGVMMRLTAVVALFPDLPEAELQAWVERGWVRPEGTERPTGCSRKSMWPGCG